MNENAKSAAQLQREVEAQRTRVEDRIGEIQNRLSPGQLLDEALSYTRNGPGAEFTANLKRSVTANPLPVALMGLSLAWLMARPPAAEADTRRYRDDRHDEETWRSDYPLAPVSGRALTRLRHAAEDDGKHYSEFADETGRKFRALSDEAGNRAGHFIDEAGQSFSGFVDETGNRIAEFRNEAGELIDEATGWASHQWGKATRGVKGFGEDVAHGLSAGSEKLQRGAADAGATIQAQGQRAAETLTGAFREQPLVGGAMAFALGAAIAAWLPRTAQEDELLGEAADQVKDRAAAEAAHLAEAAKDKAAELHDEAAETISQVYEGARDAVETTAEHGKERIEERHGASH